MSAWTGSLNSLLFQCLFPLTPQKEVTTFPLKPQKFPQRRFLPSDDSLSVCVGPMGPSSVGFLASSTHSAGTQMRRSGAVESVSLTWSTQPPSRFGTTLMNIWTPESLNCQTLKLWGAIKLFVHIDVLRFGIVVPIVHKGKTRIGAEIRGLFLIRVYYTGVLVTTSRPENLSSCEMTDHKY